MQPQDIQPSSLCAESNLLCSDYPCHYLSYALPKQMITGIASLKSSVFFFCLVCQSKQMLNSLQLAQRLGYTTHQNDDESLYQLRQHIYQPDYNFSIQSERLGLAFWNNLPFSEQRNYMFVYQCRLVNKDGKPILYTHKSTVLHNNSQGIVCCVMIESSPLIHYNDDEGTLLRFMLHIGTKKCYSIEANNSKKAFNLLSPHMIKVLALVAQGYNTQQIADKLYLSINTIKTHKRNILRSTNSNNMTQALLFAQLLNLLP